MDDWKELDIKNLPPDILVGDYEFVFNNSVGWDYSSETRFGVIKNLMDNAFEYRYRKRAPKAPSHKEVVKKLIEDINKGSKPYNDTLICDLKTAVLYLLVKSADTPPES